MKKLISLLCALLALTLLPTALATSAEDAYPAGAPLAANQMNNVPGFGYLIPLNFTLDQYALSSAAYSRSWDDKIYPYYPNAGHMDVKNNYLQRYIQDGYALTSSSSDYRLVDMPVIVENRTAGAIDPAVDVSARLIVAGQYPWEVAHVYQEVDDTQYNRYELLQPAKSIDANGHAVVHYVFDIPVAAADMGLASGLRVDFTINGAVWSLELGAPLPTQAEMQGGN